MRNLDPELLLLASSQDPIQRERLSQVDLQKCASTNLEFDQGRGQMREYVLLIRAQRELVAHAAYE